MAARVPSQSPASGQISKRKRNGARRRSKGMRWLQWWPLLAGLAVTPFAVRYAEVLPLLGRQGMTRLREIFPLALLCHQPQFAIPEPVADALGRALLYLQFPLYGLLATLLLQVSGFLRTAVTVGVVHVVMVGIVLLMASM